MSQSIFDHFMPTWRLREVDHVAVCASPEATWSAVRTIDLSRIPAVRSPLAPPLIPDRVLAEVAGRELVFGAAGMVRHPQVERVEIEPGAFAGFGIPHSVKVACGVAVAPRPSGAWITIDLRASTSDERALARYRHYWRFARGFAHAIGTALAEELGRAPADERSPLVGDDLLPAVRTQVTHQVDIEAPPAQVWPWLVQMGRRRAGWYSWDLLDNGGVPSAHRIVPALQKLAVGDILPIKAKGPDGFAVLALDPPHALVLGDPSLLPGRSRPTGDAARATWAFSLEPIGDTAAHLVVRVRAEYPSNLLVTLLRPVVVGVHDVMERRQLRAIKQRAEAR